MKQVVTTINSITYENGWVFLSPGDGSTFSKILVGSQRPNGYNSIIVRLKMSKEYCAKHGYQLVSTKLSAKNWSKIDMYTISEVVRHFCIGVYLQKNLDCLEGWYHQAFPWLELTRNHVDMKPRRLTIRDVFTGFLCDFCRKLQSKCSSRFYKSLKISGSESFTKWLVVCPRLQGVHGVNGGGEGGLRHVVWTLKHLVHHTPYSLALGPFLLATLVPSPPHPPGPPGVSGTSGSLGAQSDADTCYTRYLWVPTTSGVSRGWGGKGVRGEGYIVLGLRVPTTSE